LLSELFCLRDLGNSVSPIAALSQGRKQSGPNAPAAVAPQPSQPPRKIVGFSHMTMAQKLAAAGHL
jgi:hypothetical protein